MSSCSETVGRRISFQHWIDTASREFPVGVDVNACTYAVRPGHALRRKSSGFDVTRVPS